MTTVNELIAAYAISIAPDGEHLQVSLPPRKAQDREEIIARKAEILAALREEAAAKAQEAQDRAAKLAALDGLQELRAAHSAEAQYREDYRRYIESGGLRKAPHCPDPSYSDLAAKYPRAAAYLTACAWQRASNYVKAGLGRTAAAAILDGADHVAALAEMEEAWSKYCYTAID